MLSAIEKLLLLWKGKTYLAAIGLVGLAVYNLSVADYTSAITHFLAALAAAGLRSAVTDQTKQIEQATDRQTEELKKTASMPVTLKTTVTPRGDAQQTS